MSAPNKKQVVHLLERVSALLDEYDDTAYYIMVLDDNCMWRGIQRLSRRDKVVISQGLLTEALKVHKRRRRKRR